MKTRTRNIKHKLNSLKNKSADGSASSRPFDFEETKQALKNIKANKVPGFDGIHNEFLTNTGPLTRRWLADFYTDVLHTGSLSKEFKARKS